MKKSVAIKLLAGLLRNNNFGSHHKEAQEILNFLEELGMLPPATEIYCTCSHADGTANVWEDEG